MRLKALELHGFKSFPDKTVLRFEEGMTAVVGPNGSGKSNISDAIRWVLGEVSSRSVRGTKMEDVIFGGSDNRRQMTFAEVSLTLDNSGTENRLAADYDEVTVTRRYYRSGESEYMINHKPVRLRDIAELFMNTGLGRTGYSIVGQGKIAEIISQKSDERRMIFEEAAGISKYRYKKNEAERKLASVEENLIRLCDIRNELEARVGPLEKEAERAKKYLEIYGQKKEADISLWLHDIEAIRRQVKETEESFRLAKRELEIADDTLNSYETQNEKLFEVSQENKMQSERTAERIKTLSEEGVRLEGSVGLLENDIAHVTEQITRTKAEMEQRTVDREVQTASLATLETEHQTLSAEETRIAAERQQAETDLAALYRARTDAESAVKSAAAALEALREERVNLRLKRTAMVTEGESAASRRAELATTLQNAEADIKTLTDRMKKAQETIATYDAKLGELRGQADQSNERARTLHDEMARMQDAIGERKVEISSARQRIETLRRMEEQLEGYGQSVRRVMQAASSGALDGICGPLSRIIHVPGNYAVALETALGASIQNIVVEDERAAKEAIAYLKNNHAGRATFYPLTSMKPSPLPVKEEDLRRRRGFVGIASALVTFEEKYRPVVEYLLGRTVVFDNLDNATDMARGTGYRVRAVTLDGQQINAGGSFTGGSVKHDSGMLTRGAEMDKIRESIARAENEAAARQAELEAHRKEAEAAESEAESLNGQMELIRTIWQAENTQLKVLEAQLENDRAQIRTVTEAQAELDARAEAGSAASAELDAALLSLDEKITSAEAEGEAHEAARAAQAREIAEKQEEHNRLQLRLTELHKDIEAVNRSLSFAHTTLDAISAQTARDEETVVSLTARIADSETQIAAHRARREEISAEIASLEEERASHSAAAQKQDETIAALRVKIREQTHLRENLFREYTRLESKCSQTAAEQDKLTARLWEEYEMTCSSAMEAGYRAVEASARQAVAARQTELRNKLRGLGSVNVSAIDEYKEVRERYDFLTAQTDDLITSKNDLTGIIAQLEQEMRQRFTEVMEQLNVSFQRIFRELFGGGSAELHLEDPENVLESGIVINVAPPGKIIKNLSLLSGGEQAFVSIAILFAIIDVNPTPFCVLDEIEAALDDVNVARFAEYARRYCNHTQFIVITHRRGTMERADTLYGVTMPERGISKVLSLNVGEVESRLGVKL